MTEETDALVIAIAKAFITLLQTGGEPWEKGFFRFESRQNDYGCNASYVVAGNATLISALREKDFYNSTRELSRQLVLSLKKTDGVFLLIVDSHFEYEIKFEWEDMSKWKITKMDGGNGIPLLS